MTLKTTKDFEGMVRLGKEAGLEITELGPTLSAYGAFKEDTLVGCACLKEHKGVYMLECLAVSKPCRGHGLGTRLVRAVEGDAKLRGAAEIRALARSPAFFLKVGYRIADPKEIDYPTTNSCEGCLQYRKSCQPAVVVRSL